MTLQDALEIAGNIPAHHQVTNSGATYQKVVEALAKLHTYYEIKEREGETIKKPEGPPNVEVKNGRDF